MGGGKKRPGEQASGCCLCLDLTTHQLHAVRSAAWAGRAGQAAPGGGGQDEGPREVQRDTNGCRTESSLPCTAACTQLTIACTTEPAGHLPEGHQAAVGRPNGLDLACGRHPGEAGRHLCHGQTTRLLRSALGRASTQELLPAC